MTKVYSILSVFFYLIMYPFSRHMPERDDLSSDAKEALEVIGEVLLAFSMYGSNTVLASSYLLPVDLAYNARLVGNILKIPIDTSLLPDGVLLSDFEDERFLDVLKRRLIADVSVVSSPASPLTAFLTEDVSSNFDNFASAMDLWIRVDLNRNRLRMIKRSVMFEDFPVSNPPSDMLLPFPLGFSVGDRPMWADLHDELVHILVGGATRSGKSTFIKFIIKYFSEVPQPFPVDFYLLDCKFGVEFNRAKFPDVELFHIYQTDDPFEIFSTVDKFLDDIYDSMRKRYTEYIKPSGVTNLYQYNALPGVDPIPISIAIIDELATFLNGRVDLSGKSEKESTVFKQQAEIRSWVTTLHSKLGLLASQAAGAGIHLIGCTQRPSTDVVPGIIKINFPGRICFSMPTIVDADVILGEGNGENSTQLGCPGRFWGVYSDYFIECQSPYVQ